MVLDANDLERLKANVPENHQPPVGSGGRLSNLFDFSVDLRGKSTALQSGALDERDRFNLGMAFAQGDNADASGPSFLLGGAASAAQQAHVAAVKRREAQEDRHHTIQRIIDQIEARNHQIAENMRQLRILDLQETALQDQRTRLQRGERADLDENGRLRDANAEAAVREYEERYGVRIDRNDAGQIETVLHSVHDERSV